jgi:hypothetical protein
MCEELEITDGYWGTRAGNDRSGLGPCHTKSSSLGIATLLYFFNIIDSKKKFAI